MGQTDHNSNRGKPVRTWRTVVTDRLVSLLRPQVTMPLLIVVLIAAMLWAGYAQRGQAGETYTFYEIPVPAAIALPDGTGVKYAPLPPGCILGVPNKYVQSEAPNRETSK